MPFFLLVVMIVALFMCPPLSALAAAALWILVVYRRPAPAESGGTIGFVKDDGTIVQIPLGY